MTNTPQGFKPAGPSRGSASSAKERKEHLEVSLRLWSFILAVVVYGFLVWLLLWGPSGERVTTATAVLSTFGGGLLAFAITGRRNG